MATCFAEVERGMVLGKKRLLVAAVGVILVLSVTAVGWALMESRTGRSPESNTPSSSAEPTLPPTASPVSPSPTQSPTATPVPSSAPVHSVSDGLCLTMLLDRTVYVLGESVNVTLAIVNVSDHIVNFTHTGMDFDFVVYNGSDNVVYRWSTGKAFPMFIMIMSLQPGQNVTATYVWPQTCNSVSSAMGVSVSPGTYYIVGESNPSYGLRTAPIQIIIVGVEPSPQEQVRDDVMGYIGLNHPETLQFMNGLNWTGGRVTPPKLVGAETYMYYSQGWNVTISYPVVPNPVYKVRADFSAPGVSIPYRVVWEGTWQNGVINETSYVFAQ